MRFPCMVGRDFDGGFGTEEVVADGVVTEGGRLLSIALELVPLASCTLVCLI